jgi:hypothetical protein
MELIKVLAIKTMRKNKMIMSTFSATKSKLFNKPTDTKIGPQRISGKEISFDAPNLWR